MKKFWQKIFSSRKSNSPDVLGRYPEYMQVYALPERRYMKTSRLLAIFILINLGITMALGGYYGYLAERVDVVISNRRAVNLFYIDTEKKQLRPAEHEKKGVLATQLMAEALLRQYIVDRHTITWDNDDMMRRWGAGGAVFAYSSKNSYSVFNKQVEQQMLSSRSQGYVRDVHLYEVEYIYQNMWQAIFDVFEMPVPDSFNPLCNSCTDNSKECIECKVKYATKRQRYKVYIRTSFLNPQTVANPLGFMVYSYQMLPMAAEDNSYWDTPRALKPEL